MSNKIFGVSAQHHRCLCENFLFEALILRAVTHQADCQLSANIRLLESLFRPGFCGLLALVGPLSVVFQLIEHVESAAAPHCERAHFTVQLNKPLHEKRNRSDGSK